jgi:pyruvate formate lyase activating enzyme
MKIRGFIDTSFVDWDGKISSVVFTEGCNMRCNFCYNFGLVLHPQNFDLVEEDHILEYLGENSDFLDGVCISGGEPTLQKDLLQFCREIKGLGLDVKLDTNGMNPKLLKQLIDEGLIDYIAMDVKAPLNEKEYSEVAGVSLNGSMDDIKRSIQIIIDSGLDHEFRTTVVPGVHTVDGVEAISKSLAGARRLRLQKFQPHTRFENLNVKKSQSDEEMEEFAEAARRHIKEVEWRGR